MHAGEAFQFAFGFFFGFRRKIFRIDFFTIFFRLHIGVFRFAQLLLNSLQLLSQIIVTLALINVTFDFCLNFIAQLQNLHLMIHQTR